MGSLRPPRKKGGKYEYRFKDENGQTIQKALATDKGVSRSMAAQIDKDIINRKAGITSDFLDHAKKPIADHLKEFRAHLESKGNCKDYVQDAISCCERIISACSFKRITDLNGDKVGTWLQSQRQVHDMSTRSSNRHSTAIKGFSNWLFRSRKTQDHRLVGLTSLNVEVDRKRVRRALNDDDFAKLLQATLKSPRIDLGETWRFDGLSRHCLYLMAYLTGLRASELESLKVQDFNPFSRTIQVEAKNTKNHKVALLPLHDEACQVLTDHIIRNQLNPKDQIWKGDWATLKRAGAILKRDLKAAGVQYKDQQGRVFDFHSLRVQFGTSLAKADVSLKKAQELMRHSTPVLTAKVYQQLTTADLTESIHRLSIPKVKPQQIETQQAAG